MAEEGVDRDDWLTIPNVLSMLRMAGVPVFLWLILTGQDGWALTVLLLSSITDYLDGKIARRFNLMSRLGRFLDPIADRAYIASTLLGLGVTGIIPWWLVLILVARDATMTGMYPLSRLYRLPAPPTHYLGKAATFNLLCAFPLLLLAAMDLPIAEVARPLGWAVVLWGTGLYVLSGMVYTWQMADMVVQRRAQYAAVAL